MSGTGGYSLSGVNSQGNTYTTHCNSDGSSKSYSYSNASGSHYFHHNGGSGSGSGGFSKYSPGSSGAGSGWIQGDGRGRYATGGSKK